MVQILQPQQRQPGFLENLIGGTISKMDEYSQGKAKQKALEKEYALKGQLEQQKQESKFANQMKLQEQQQRYLDKIWPGVNSEQENLSDLGLNSDTSDAGMLNENDQMDQFNPKDIPDEFIARLSVINPQGASQLQKIKDVALRENRENESNKNKKFESERAYHTQFSKPIEEKATALRGLLPKQEMAIDYARNAIESGEVGAFTMNHLADIFNADSLRNAKGAQLILASKEQLIPNLGRISAKAQNIFMEKRIASMIPQIGLKDEANLTMQEMIEGEAAIDRAYLSELDRLTEQDMKEYGFTRKDIDKRARSNANVKEKEIVKRTSYRMKEIEENSKGLSKVKKEVGKNVSKGTPLTLAMAKLYQEKFGDNALKVAEKNGYYIPTKEEFMMFEQRPSEFRESL